MKPNWSSIEQEIADSVGTELDISRRELIGGGSINQTFVLRGGSGDYFVKLNQAERLDMFGAEFAGLKEIQQSNTLAVPEPYCFGAVEESAFLAMEYLHAGHNDKAGMLQFAHDLASMHRVTTQQFGWNRDNTIGSTPQINTCSDDWGHFWQQQRLLFQLELAGSKGYRGRLQRQGERLAAKTTDFFDHSPAASLLHGDLWSGNYFISERGLPLVFDPALYYGDRETDLAMTELFGGFSSDFYSVYNDVYPLDSGYKVRKILYNLYHILNHLNIFGDSYLTQAEDMIDRLLSEV